MELWCGVAVRRKGRVLLLKRTHTGDSLLCGVGRKERSRSTGDDEVLAGASPSAALPNHQLNLVGVPVWGSRHVAVALWHLF